MSILADDMIVYLSDLKNSTLELLELITISAKWPEIKSTKINQ